MEAFDALMGGFAIALQPTTLMWGFIGCFVGTLVGVLPGIGPALTIALLLPLTYHVPATSMFVMFAGIYYGAAYGGSTTSILLNTPGESAAVVTALEGNKMARRGRAGQALATAAIGSLWRALSALWRSPFLHPWSSMRPWLLARPNTSASWCCRWWRCPPCWATRCCAAWWR
jgi:putative tricarboxylic transport membrane protein